LLTKAVIPAAGLGTRLLSATKEQPKEMLPVFSTTTSGELCLKPIVQLVFEQLHQAGFREFCFIVGKEKRAIEDHFTPDHAYVSKLQKMGKTGASDDLNVFYDMIEQSTLVWINQPEPRGFGDAVLKAKSFVGADSFLVHAGDSYIQSPNSRHLERLRSASETSKADVAFLAQRVQDPRRYGVVEGTQESEGVVHVTRLVEKPQKPASNLAIMPVYAFNSIILKALEVTPIGLAGEIQLTDGIQKIIEWKLAVRALELEKGDIRLDIGSPELYWEAQNLSYNYSVASQSGEKRAVAPLIGTKGSGA
jgi:UTP--glucose-1-phosphate uridylyltransferase